MSTIRDVLSFKLPTFKVALDSPANILKKTAMVAIPAIALFSAVTAQQAEAGPLTWAACMAACAASTGGAFLPACHAACVALGLTPAP